MRRDHDIASRGANEVTHFVTIDNGNTSKLVRHGAQVSD
jgi:hypothetical protein